jgi:hypothetical protein
MDLPTDNSSRNIKLNRREAMTDRTLTIRRADITDAGALNRLAALDSSSPPVGDSLVAEVGQELWAAVEIDSGSAIADPFRPSADLVDLLRFRVESIRSEAAGQRRRFASLLPRAA